MNVEGIVIGWTLTAGDDGGILGKTVDRGVETENPEVGDVVDGSAKDDRLELLAKEAEDGVSIVSIPSESDLLGLLNRPMETDESIGTAAHGSRKSESRSSWAEGRVRSSWSRQRLINSRVSKS